MGFIASILHLPVLPLLLRSILIVTDREVVNVEKKLISKRVFRIPKRAILSNNLEIKPLANGLEIRISDPGEVRERRGGAYELGRSRFTVVGPDKARSVHVNNSLNSL